MTEPQLLPVTTHAEFEARFRDCLARAHVTLQLFDPDFAVFPLGDSGVDAALRTFLHGSGTLQLAAHSTAHIERHYPRFLRLLRDYSHRVECRVTNSVLHQLTDSFCIADGIHVLRRFHSDRIRGQAAFDAPGAAEIPKQRFAAIWAESYVALQPTATGL